MSLRVNLVNRRKKYSKVLIYHNLIHVLCVCHLRLAAHSQKERVSTVRRVDRQILVVKVQRHLFHFEAKLLVQTNGRIGGRHVQRDVFAHARLRQMVEHEAGDARALPAGAHGHERDVGVVVADVGHEKRAADHETFVQGNDAEFGVGQAFGHCAEKREG